MSEERRARLAGLGGDGLGPSVGLGAKGQLRAEGPAPSWGERGCSAWRASLGKSTCACPGQGPGAQLGVHPQPALSHVLHGPLTPVTLRGLPLLCLRRWALGKRRAGGAGHLVASECWLCQVLTGGCGVAMVMGCTAAGGIHSLHL